MTEIGFAYFLIIVVAWILRIQRKKKFSGKILLIANRLFVFVSTLLLFYWMYNMYILMSSEYWEEEMEFANRTGLYFIYALLPLLMFFFCTLFLIRRIAMNIWISSILAIIGFSQNASVYIPFLSFENMLYYFYYSGNYLPSSWNYDHPEIIWVLIKNGIFVFITYILFKYLKESITKEDDLYIDDHLIES